MEALQSMVYKKEKISLARIWQRFVEIRKKYITGNEMRQEKSEFVCFTQFVNNLL